MSHLGEEAEAFFKKGDEGTYEGGPRSVLPSSRDVPENEDDNLTAELIAGQLERRGRLQRLVTRIVGGLGVGVLLLVPVRLRASHAAAAAVTESLGTITPRQPAALPAAVQAPPPSPASVAIPAEPSALPAPSPESDKAAAIGAIPASQGHKQHVAVKHSQPQGNRRAVLVTRPTKTLTPVPLSHGRPSSSGPHAPPTATFPD